MVVKFNKPFLIAEIGINHNGNLDIAKKLIDNSVLAGFDAVKFQKRNIDKVYSKLELESLRDSPWGKTFREQKEGLEFNYDEYEVINNYCRKKNISWFASAWDLSSLDFLKQFDLKYNKVASAMIVDETFLEKVALQKKHTFISTGMSSLPQISKAVKIFEKHNCSFELMHCISTYPMKTKDANLVTIHHLKEKFNCNVGYSGHENGVAVSLAAIFFNISSLERHITLDRSMYGSDQSASLELKGMEHLTNTINKMIEAFGQNMIGEIIEDEIPVANKLRSHLVYND